MVRTRIAPSPTGYLHIGTARTALFNYLFAKKSSGAFVVRIEDTNLERSDKKFEAEILESLEWFGITADESPTRGGKYGPYRQSDRLDKYTPYLTQLLAAGKAFYCPHSEAELEAEKKTLLAAGKNPVHACQYRDPSTGSTGSTNSPQAGSLQTSSGQAAHGRGIIRFKTPAGETLSFRDLIRGQISFATDLLGDFSIAKDLHTPLYNFAVVVDDNEMAISHVIRGEDHISNTPKQMLIQEALGLTTPNYAHLPLILGPDRAKLSKRHGATAIREFREAGYLAEALVNFMALLGWNPGGERELFTMDELTEHFNLSKVQKSGAVFDRAKLDWMNGEYIRRKSPAELAELLRPYTPRTADAPLLERVAALEQPRLKRLTDIRAADLFFTAPNYDATLLSWKGMSPPDVHSALTEARDVVAATAERDFTTAALERRFLDTIGGGDKGRLLWPLRAALSGQVASPGPFDIMAILGKAETLRRIQTAIEKTAEH